MKSIQEIFASLAQRLYTLKTPSVYVPDFDFKKIMDDIEAEIVIYSQDAAAKEVNKYLSQISELIQENRNFFKDFVRIEYTIQTWQDEHGNTCSEEETQHVPLPEWQMDSVNESIQFELQYYGVTLNKLSGYLSNGPVRKRKEKSNVVRFYYKFYDTNPDQLTDLLDSLKRSGFVGEETKQRVFKKCFGGRSAIERKIRWIGTISSLCYFIKQIHEIGILNDEIDSCKWIITNSLFCDENGIDFTADLGRQKLPKEEDRKLIDKAINNLRK